MRREKDPTHGKIIEENGQLFLDTGTEKLELSSELLEFGDLKKFAGKKVELIYSSPQKFIIGFRPPRMKPILCYVAPPFRPPYICYLPLPRRPPQTCYIVARPVGPELIQETVEQARKDLLDQLVEQKFITTAQYKQILKIKDILCYYPVQDQLQRVQDKVRIEMADQLLEQGIISRTVYDKIT